MSTTKVFRPEFKTRNGKQVTFGASYTHDTQAKRRAGLTKTGHPPVASVGAGTILRRPRRWAPWAVFGVSSSTIAATAAVHFLGPVAGGVLVVFVGYFLYRTVRWTAGEVAYFATKGRQIRGREQVATADDVRPTVGDKVTVPAARP